MQMFEVGGCVRDEILGIPSKDIDFSVVLDETDLLPSGTTVTTPDPFRTMVLNLEGMGFKVFVETPEHLTVRAQFPEGDGGYDVLRAGGKCKPGRKRLTADFVLARKEGNYSDGRRPDSVEIGTLHDDLARRDLTVNALAKASDGTLIDPFGGVQDINSRVLRAVGNAPDRLNEDALRALRALRFSVTLGFKIDTALKFAMENANVIHSIKYKISDERIKDELHKMLTFDTLASLRAFRDFPILTEAIFSGSVWLDSTMKGRK